MTNSSNNSSIATHRAAAALCIHMHIYQAVELLGCETTDGATQKINVKKTSHTNKKNTRALRDSNPRLDIMKGNKAVTATC